MNQYKSEQLNSEHTTNFFDCGEPSMDTWLDTKALRDQQLGISATQVWVDAGDMVVAYYTLLPTVVTEQDTLWKRLKAKGPYYGDVYGVLIGKIALDRSLRGQGYGEELFGEAIFNASEAMELIGGLYVVIEPMENRPKLRTMYEEFGFATLDGTDRMYMRVRCHDPEPAKKAKRRVAPPAN